MLAATAVSALGTVYSGVGTSNEARYASQVAANNATYARRQSADAEDRGVREQVRKGQEVAQVRSAQIAAAAANGLDTSFGSAADVVADTTVGGMLDQSIIRENAAREATGFQISAQNYDQESKAQKRASRDALVKTAFDVGGTILGGAGKIAGMKTPVAGRGTAAALAKSYITPNTLFGAIG